MKILGVVEFANIFLLCFGDTAERCQINKTSEWYCCAPFHESNGECKVCPNGSAVINPGENCTDCEDGFFGQNCFQKCDCKDEERCDQVDGCTIYTETTMAKEKMSKRSTLNNYYNSQAELMTTLSISVAVISLIVVLIITVGKWYSKVMQTRESVIDTITKKCKDKQLERSTNIYGSYCSKSCKKNKEEYDFDSDEFEEEDAYSEIRTSQMIPMTTFPVKSETMDQYDKYSQYNTDEYNHLNQMGIKRIPGQQQSKEYKYAKKNDARRLLTFEDEYI